LTATERLEKRELRKTAAWFESFKPLLEARSTYRRQMKGAPFHAVYNVGVYTFKPWKVIWPEMSSSFYEAVAGSADVPLVGTRTYIPDHKVYFSAFDDEETAYYLCRLLNSKTVQEWIGAHNVSIQVADIFKHLDLPEFNKKDIQHILLAERVMSAHKEHDRDARRIILDEIKFWQKIFSLNGVSSLLVNISYLQEQAINGIFSLGSVNKNRPSKAVFMFTRDLVC